MHSTVRLLASERRRRSASLLSRPEPLALLPPLQLYRRLLRAHRKLPPDLRLLGDSYVKQEFRLHRDTDNPVHIVGFLSQWQLYAQQIEGDSWRDGKLEKEKIDKMSDDQIRALWEMRGAVFGEGGGLVGEEAEREAAEKKEQEGEESGEGEGKDGKDGQ